MSRKIEQNTSPTVNARFLTSLAATIAFTAIGGYALYHVTRTIDPDEIRASLSAIEGWRFISAAVFSLLCYLALSGYDVIALRALNYHLPWRRSVAASTAAYALSHNLGFAPLTASYARHRVYAGDGVNLGDIARIVVLTGTSFWIGVIFIVGICLVTLPNLASIYWEDAGDHIQQLAGWGILASVAGYLFAIRIGLSRLGFGRFYIPLPNLRDAVLQLGVSTAEMALSAAIIFILVPGIDLALYPQMLAAYVVAFTAVLITHTPGGVGVLEAIILLLVPQVDKAALLSALIIFRLVYHIGPLITSVVILVAHRSRANDPNQVITR
jgi:uncharacterized membrane protein YbhN (UPF0104 family)